MKTKKKPLSSFSGELRQRRETEGLTLRELESETGISDTMICHYEAGKGLLEMSFKHLKALSDYFHWDLVDMARKAGREGTERKEASEESA
jgi:transcriptional regulator with XRE-family HTH domain